MPNVCHACGQSLPEPEPSDDGLPSTPHYSQRDREEVISLARRARGLTSADALWDAYARGLNVAGIHASDPRAIEVLHLFQAVMLEPVARPMGVPHA